MYLNVVLQRFLGVEELAALPALFDALHPLIPLPMETHVLLEVMLELSGEVTLMTPVNKFNN